jgi:threonine aldolase
MSEKKVIDLRSDTVTKPTPAMRQAMAEAEVGNDVYMEDPTVNRLQAKAAEMMGTEAALFVPSGTMGNQIAIRIHTEPGQEIITEERGHIYNYEMAAMAVISGTLARPIRTEDGILDLDSIRKAIRPKIYYRAQTGLITVENTHNYGGGSVYSVERSREITHFAREAGIPIHLDGARIFNAATALDCSPQELTKGFDSVMFCLSKGLSAPVGSVLCGSHPFIERARSTRQLLGGGMRQAGVLAAPGLVALETMVDRLAEDHENARVIAENLALIDGIGIDPKKVRTNVVIFEITRRDMTSRRLLSSLKDRYILAGPVDDKSIRMLTHHDVSRQDCLTACEAIGKEMRT